MPLADQIVEVEKEIRDRGRRYPAMVEKGRLTQARADEKMAALRAVQSTLTWLAANEPWIRAEAGRRATAERQRRELAEISAAMAEEPAVAAVLAAFPGAEITSVEPIPTDGG